MTPASQRLCAASVRYRAARPERQGAAAEEGAPARAVLQRIALLDVIVPDPEHSEEAVVHLSVNWEWDR
ncbi:hypothetical protein ACV35G_32030, partial [Pseudomonas aeruginosa]